MGFALSAFGLLLGLAGSFMQASYTAKAAKEQAKAQNIQLKANMEVERINGMAKANERIEQYQRLQATNRVNVAINTPMGGRDYSYEEGVVPYNKEVMKRDVATTNFNTGQEIGRMAYQIKVNDFEAKSAGKAAWVGAAASGLGQVGSFIGGLPTGTKLGGVASPQPRIVYTG